MKVTILGGGISGLATAWKLSKEQQVEIIEKSSKVGGMASSYKYKEFSLDYGPHKIYTQLPGIMDDFKSLVKDDLMTIPKKNKIYVNGKFFDFPIKITQLATRLNPLIAASCGLGMAESLIRKDKTKSYESYLKNNFGRGMYNLLFRDYALKVWGDPKELAEELAIKRIPVSGFADLIKGILFGVKKEQSAEHFYYPKKGIGTVCDRIVKQIEKNKGKILTKTKIEKINIQKNKVESITINKKKEKTDYLVSTIPITDLVKIIEPKPPENVLKAAKRLKYRSLIVLTILVDKKNALDCNWIFFPSADIIFNRLSEQKSFSKHTCPEDKTALYVEITCDYDDWRWNASDYDLFELVMRDLEKIGVLKREEVLEYFSKKAKKVYPVYSLDYKKNLTTILDYLDTIENLQTTGRQGLFNYNNMDHCIDMANKTAEYINNNKRKQEWKDLRKYFDSYKIFD